MNNLNLINLLIESDQKTNKIFQTMLDKLEKKEFGKIIISYESGKIVSIKNEINIK